VRRCRRGGRWDRKARATPRCVLRGIVGEHHGLASMTSRLGRGCSTGAHRPELRDLIANTFGDKYSPVFQSTRSLPRVPRFRAVVGRLLLMNRGEMRSSGSRLISCRQTAVDEGRRGGGPAAARSRPAGFPQPDHLIGSLG
jgi:hypothetical protein